MTQGVFGIKPTPQTTLVADKMLRIFRTAVRVFAWLGFLTVILLSIVPASDRPVTGLGHAFEHFAAFTILAASFALGYPRPLRMLLVAAIVFCGGIELLQIPLPTRHARLSDFVIDVTAACIAIGIIVTVRKVASRPAGNLSVSRTPRD